MGEINKSKLTKERTGNMHEEIKEAELWGNIRRTAKTNEGLRDLLDKAIMYYQLLKVK
jgi:hypothetical protein